MKATFGDKLAVACDVCICPYTSHGHCGIFRRRESSGKGTGVGGMENGGTPQEPQESFILDNEASVARLAEIAASYAGIGSL